MIKTLLYKIINLWQSQDRKYTNLKDSGIFLIIMAAVSFVISLIIFNKDFISLTRVAKCTFMYIGVLCFMISINLFNFYLYIFNKNKSLSGKAKTFLILILIFFVLTCIAMIPFTIMACIIGWIVRNRAKKMDNLISFMICLVVILIGTAFFIYPNFIGAYIVSAYIEGILLKYSFYISVFPLGLFLFINLFTFEGWLISKILILLKKYSLNKNKSNKQKILEKSFEKNTDTKDLDIKSYVENKSNKMIEINSKLTDEVEHDISYLKNTLKRVELSVLIILFIIIALKIVPNNLLDLVNKYQSDSINVITIYTLIMLYIDKRKEWK